MEIKEPKVFQLAQTEVNYPECWEMQSAIGVDYRWNTNEKSCAGYLIEVCGRLCYKAFGTKLNRNVNKVREGNEKYIKNLLDVGHGSVLEHATVTFAFIDVTRVFTHEIVRHRAGTAFSQESLRYVRLTDLGAYFPDTFTEGFGEWDEERPLALREAFKDGFEYAEKIQKLFAELTDIDAEKDFKRKKELTSAFRRLAPIGLTTNIVVTANHRAWRHVIAMRCSEHAEEEICKVMRIVANKLQLEFPNIYQDMTLNDDGTVTFTNEKV